MKLSYVIVSHNRCDALMRTLAILHETTPLPRDAWEIFVVDNASADGSVDAVRLRFPETRIIQRGRNEGVGARSHAFAHARGEFVILLDDDSYPIDNAVIDSMDYLDANRNCGAVVGAVLLPDGSREACAFPSVMLSGAVCIRKSVIDRVGGFRREFFRKAGEYDFSFRIWQAGFTIERFEDIVYRHDKVMAGRSSAFAHRMDLRNNLILVERFLPADARQIYREDFTQRYAALASAAGEMKAAKRAIHEAKLWRVREMIAGRQTLSRAAFEVNFDWQRQADAVAAWAKANQIRRVAIADYSKNLFATWRAAQLAGLQVIGIVDDNPAFASIRYRGCDVIASNAFDRKSVDGVILSNVNPAQVDSKLKQMSTWHAGPTLRLWHPRFVRDANTGERKVA